MGEIQRKCDVIKVAGSRQVKPFIKHHYGQNYRRHPKKTLEIFYKGLYGNKLNKSHKAPWTLWNMTFLDAF